MVDKKELQNVEKEENLHGKWVLNVLDYLQNNDDEAFNHEWEEIIKVSKIGIIR